MAVEVSVEAFFFSRFPYCSVLILRSNWIYDTHGLLATPQQQNSSGSSGPKCGRVCLHKQCVLRKGLFLCLSRPCLLMTGRYAKVMANISFIMFDPNNFLCHPGLFTDRSNPPRQQLFHKNPEPSQSPSAVPMPERELVHRGSDRAWSPS